METYKKGQGVYARFSALAALGLLVLYGSAQLYLTFNRTGTFWTTELFVLPGLEWVIDWGKVISTAVFGGAMYGLYMLLFNQKKTADFLIETESELKKVSWPSQKQWVNMSIIVICVVAVIGLYLWGVDKSLSFVLGRLKIGV